MGSRTRWLRGNTTMKGAAIVLAEWATRLAVLALVVGALCSTSWPAVIAAMTPPASQPAAAGSAPATRHAEIRVARPAVAAMQPAAIRPSAELRAQYDKDHDGTLSEPERRAMVQDLSEQNQQQFMQMLVQRYDADKNGAVDDQERARFYLDGDGEVGGEERGVAQGAGWLDMDIRRLAMDTDADGKASPAEQQAYWRSVVAKYDLDADGLLNTQERQRRRYVPGEKRERFRPSDGSFYDPRAAPKGLGNQESAWSEGQSPVEF